jgi:hypothetical protein
MVTTLLTLRGTAGTLDPAMEWLAPRAVILIAPFTTRFPVTTSTVNNLRTGGVNVCPAAIVRSPFTTAHEETESEVLENQSEATKGVVALRVIGPVLTTASCNPEDWELTVSRPLGARALSGVVDRRLA